MTEFGGYMGKVLRVDLSSGRTSEDSLGKDLIVNFLGGRGFASKMLFDELDPRIDPFDPKNKLIFTTGPLTGTPLPLTSRYAVATLSPLTNLNTVGYAGGHFGPELKYSGFDGVVFEGRAEKPVYLLINNDEIELRSAVELWGKDTNETEDLIREDIGNPEVRVACIGPGGENLVRFASVISGRHCACGRRGPGAIMGSKNLKAVAVYGRNDISISAGVEALLETNDEILEIMKQNIVAQGFKTFGTTGSVGLVNELGFFPTKNFQTGLFEEIDKLDGPAFKEVVVKDVSCFACPVYCRKIVSVKDLKTGRPQHQTVYALGPLCGNDSLEVVSEGNMLCDRYGLDVISTGGVIAFAMECYEKELITRKDTDDLKLEWGGDSILKVIERIATREGFGDLLAEGVKRASETIGKGAEKYAMHVKGLELPGYDPRGSKGLGLNYATGNRGGDHNDGWTIAMEVFGLPYKVDRLATEGKAKLVKEVQDSTAAFDSAMFCLFCLDFGFSTEIVARMLSCVTGIEVTEKKMLDLGERIYNIERLFNLRTGITREDDTLPERLLKEPLPEGLSKGHVVELDAMLDEYYEVRGWDKQGRPTKRKIESLGL